ncbi:MAG: SAF domain-containing protein [Myxococcales bacterium]
MPPTAPSAMRSCPMAVFRLSTCVTLLALLCGAARDPVADFDPFAGCAVSAPSPDRRTLRCYGNLTAMVIQAPVGTNSAAFLETVAQAAMSAFPDEFAFEAIGIVIGGKAHPGLRVVARKGAPPLDFDASFVVLETPQGSRAIACMPAEWDFRCPAVFEQLARTLPPVTSTSPRPFAPYSAKLFGGEPRVPEDCYLATENSLSCKGAEAFWARLRPEQTLDAFVTAIGRGAPPGNSVEVHERACQVGGARRAKCKMLTLIENGAPRQTIALAEVSIDRERYRVECRFFGRPAKGPAPAVCSSLLSFSTTEAGDAEPRPAEVLVAARNLAAGTVLRYEDVALRNVPAALATKTTVGRDQATLIIGQRLVEPVEEGEPLRLTQFLVFLDKRSCCTWPHEAAAKAPASRGTVEPMDPSGRRMRKAAVATRILDPGKLLTSADLTQREFRTDLVGEHVVVDPRIAVGQKLLTPLVPGDPLRFGHLAGFAGESRCTAWEQEYLNVFAKTGAPKDTTELKCPAGSVALSGMLEVDEHHPAYAPGWVFVCRRPDGARHGVYRAWSRQGLLLAAGEYVDGRLEGPWKRYERGTLRYQATFHQGVLEGDFTEARRPRCGRGEGRLRRRTAQRPVDVGLGQGRLHAGLREGPCALAQAREQGSRDRRRGPEAARGNPGRRRARRARGLRGDGRRPPPPG